MSKSTQTLKIACYLIKIILFIVYSLIDTIISSLRTVINSVSNENMSVTPKKRKNNQHNLRGAIDANWQTLLNTLLMEKKEEKETVQKKEQFTGTFRRARKKNKLNAANINNKNLAIEMSVQNGPKIEDSAENEGKLENTHNTRNKPKQRLTKFLAMDCEMVGVGFDGSDHMLARISIVNKFGDCIYDKFVKPREKVVDYRTNVSGIRKEDLINGEDFSVVQREVAELLRDKILVGHSLDNDLKVLFLSHPKRHMRDTSRYKPFRKITSGNTPSLKRLAKDILGLDIQGGEHSSVEDARAAMQLYCTVAKDWEQILSQKKGYSRKFVES